LAGSGKRWLVPLLAEQCCFGVCAVPGAAASAVCQQRGDLPLRERRVAPSAVPSSGNDPGQRRQFGWRVRQFAGTAGAVVAGTGQRGFAGLCDVGVCRAQGSVRECRLAGERVNERAESDGARAECFSAVAINGRRGKSAKRGCVKRVGVSAAVQQPDRCGRDCVAAGSGTGSSAVQRAAIHMSPGRSRGVPRDDCQHRLERVGEQHRHGAFLPWAGGGEQRQHDHGSARRSGLRNLHSVQRGASECFVSSSSARGGWRNCECVYVGRCGGGQRCTADSVVSAACRDCSQARRDCGRHCVRHCLQQCSPGGD
jgi:hypothetical protein